MGCYSDFKGSVWGGFKGWGKSKSWGESSSNQPPSKWVWIQEDDHGGKSWGHKKFSWKSHKRDDDDHGGRKSKHDWKKKFCNDDRDDFGWKSFIDGCRKRDRDEDGGRKFKDGCGRRENDGDKGCGWTKKKDWKKFDWKGCERPEQPEEDPNAAPEIIEPTNPTILAAFSPVGSQITTVVAEDADTEDTLVFSLDDGTAPGSDAEFFRIDPETGALFVNSVLTPGSSADNDSTYEVTVYVTDGELTDQIDLDIMFYTGA
ncbi:MAG: cadherin repeat domain-containing protein [Pseudomonadota bacterium]